MGKESLDTRFEALFEGGRPVEISQIAEALGIGRATVSRLMRRHCTHTCVNQRGAYCVLPAMLGFDRMGFCRIGDLLFYRGGNQLAALVHYVEQSGSGLGLSECKAFFGANVTKQLLALVRVGRLRREREEGRFVYYAADERHCERQRAARQRHGDAETGAEGLLDALAREDRAGLELLVKVLLTVLAHPQFSAKSVALSLIRRGHDTCTEQVRGLMERFVVPGKNS